MLDAYKITQKLNRVIVHGSRLASPFQVLHVQLGVSQLGTKSQNLSKQFLFENGFLPLPQSLRDLDDFRYHQQQIFLTL